MMQKNIELFFVDGCGRCKLGGTPACKVLKWAEELQILRSIMQSSGLREEIKWGFPCYVNQNNKNVVMIYAFKDFCGLSFFKGALITDTHNLLEKTGENMQSSKMIKITDAQQILDQESTIKDYIKEAIEIEEKGLKVEKIQPAEIEYPIELLQILEEDLELKNAWESLTPGRKRGYNIFFTAAKQSATKISRIKKHIPQIMIGRGMHD